MKIIINFSFAFIFIVSGLTAQENLTISKAIKYTLENNLDIKISENYEKMAKNHGIRITITEE